MNWSIQSLWSQYPSQNFRYGYAYARGQGSTPLVFPLNIYTPLTALISIALPVTA